jgi:hypothetical protein
MIIDECRERSVHIHGQRYAAVRIFPLPSQYHQSGTAPYFLLLLLWLMAFSS